MTAAHVIWTFDDGKSVEFSADLTIRTVPDAPSEGELPGVTRCTLLAYRGEERA